MEVVLGKKEMGQRGPQGVLPVLRMQLQQEDVFQSGKR